MGYEFFVSSATVTTTENKTDVELKIENRGVAPFYFDWPVEIGILDAKGDVRESIKQQWDLPSIQPGESALKTVKLDTQIQNGEKIGIRIANPMKEGKPIRFANENQQLNGQAWLLIQ